jgi:glycosyltransferase involved in cell wall biosynthesis
MRRLIDHESEARLDVVGLDTLGSQVQGLARELGLADHVTFQGLQSADRMPGLYRGCHLLVQASRHEAGPVAVLEAAACRIATVGTAVGYLAAWSPERASAVPVGDPEALASATLSLLRDTCRREELAGRARAWALSHDADWTTARLSELYAGVR